MPTSSHGHRAGRRSKARWELSDRTKRTLIIGSVGVIVLIVGVWAVDVLIAPAKPDLQVATPQQVAEFLGHPRGFSRLPIAKREQFLVECVQRYNTPELVESMSRELSRMSYTQRQQFLDGVFEVGKENFVKAAEEYKRTPKTQKKEFVDKVIRSVDGLRRRILSPAGGAAGGGGGGGGGGPLAAGAGPAPPRPNLVSPFKDHMPQKSDQWTKMIIDRTTPSERNAIKPLADDVSLRMEELRQQRAQAG